MKAAVTGASGHIGMCLCNYLLKEGFKVKALIHKNNTHLQNLNAELIEGDINDRNSINELCTNVDVVFHLAAIISIDKKDKKKVFKTNIDGTRLITNVCLEKSVSKLIHFSSIHALNSFPLNDVLDETRELITDVNTVYDFSKAEGERIVLNAVKSGLDAVILNPTAVIGPFDYKPSYLGQALIKMYKNKLPMLINGGYDWVDVRDIAKAAINSIEKGRKGEKYLLSGNWLSLVELSKLIGEIFNRKTPKNIAPFFLAKIGIPFIKIYSDIKGEEPLYTNSSLDILKNSNKFISSEKAQKELNYNSRPIRDTIKDTFEWFKKNDLI